MQPVPAKTLALSMHRTPMTQAGQGEQIRSDQMLITSRATGGHGRSRRWNCNGRCWHTRHAVVRRRGGVLPRGIASPDDVGDTESVQSPRERANGSHSPGPRSSPPPAPVRCQGCPVLPWRCQVVGAGQSDPPRPARRRCTLPRSAVLVAALPGTCHHWKSSSSPQLQAGRQKLDGAGNEGSALSFTRC